MPINQMYRTWIRRICELRPNQRITQVRHFVTCVVVDDALVAELKTALGACAAWHKTPQFVVRYAAEPGLAKRLSD